MKTPHLKTILSSTAILICTLVLAVTPANAQNEEATQPSLYDRLGGVYGIAPVVDELIDRLDADDILNANPLINEARSRVPKAGLKYQVTALVCMLTGGPEKYSGRNMKDSHAHLKITEAEWDQMVKVFSDILNEFKVPQTEQNEIMALVGPAKADIVSAE